MSGCCLAAVACGSTLHTLLLLLLHCPSHSYVRAFTGSGFGGGINYYRNIERNWRWHECTAGQVITVPALMVTAGRDAVLPARMTEGMEAFASNLERAHVEECGHWVMLEQPEWLSRTLVEWVRKALGGDGKPSRSTLQLRSRL